MNARTMVAFAAATAIGLAATAEAQQIPGGAAARAMPRTSAPIDLTGYWVAFVSEDWRFRMVTPPKGDYTRVPLTPEARKVAAAWDPAADEAAGNQCKAFGAAAIMRVPGRLHVTWQDDSTLRLDTDAGMQARIFALPRRRCPQRRRAGRVSPSRAGSRRPCPAAVTRTLSAAVLEPAPVDR